KLATEAAENGLLDRSAAQRIVSLKGVRQSGDRAGNWLSREQERDLLAQAELKNRGRRTRSRDSGGDFGLRSAPERAPGARGREHRRPRADSIPARPRIHPRYGEVLTVEPAPDPAGRRWAGIDAAIKGMWYVTGPWWVSGVISATFYNVYAIFNTRAALLYSILRAACVSGARRRTVACCRVQ